MTSNPISHLLEPIPGDDICGTDLSFSSAFDEIREARRQDDLTLAQGDWEADLKTAEWPRVRELCEDILSRRSKDMQVAAWYTEAMARLKGFEGLSLGLQVMDSLINDFWEFCYPSYDPDDLEERAGKIEWLNNQLPHGIREIPLTDRGSGASGSSGKSRDVSITWASKIRWLGSRRSRVANSVARFSIEQFRHLVEPTTRDYTPAFRRR